ncbi:MAG: cytidine deaminase, partial [Chloroflexi bacterium]
MMNKTDSSPQILIDLANETRKKAYAPYSNYHVGAALLGKSGKIYTGVNVENAVYPLTL